MWPGTNIMFVMLLTYFICYVAGHIFQARPVWIYTPQISYSPEYTTSTQKKFILLEYIGIEGTRFCSEISLTRTVLTA
jgi:hypothetical protein